MREEHEQRQRLLNRKKLLGRGGAGGCTAGLSLLPFAILLNFYCCCTSATRFVSRSSNNNSNEEGRRKKNSLKLQNFCYFLFTTPSFPFSYPTLLPFALRFSFLLFVLFLSLSVSLSVVSVALYLSVLFHFRFVLLNLFASFLICTSLHFIVIYNLICTAIAPSPSHSPPLLSCISICI